MPLVVQTNVSAITAQRYVGQTQNNLSKSIQRLSSGLRINSPADDAAGLSIADQIKGQIVGYERASLNVQDGLSMLQVADGTLGEINSMLQRLRELAVQSANGIYNANDRQYIQQEVDELKDEINRAAYAAEFNTRKLLDGDMTALWTADNPNVNTVVNGPVKTGNYKMELNVTPGQNAVYQTTQFQYAENTSNANIIEGQEAVSNINPVNMPETNPITGEELTYNMEINDNINNGNDKDKVVMAKTVENMQDFDDSNKFKDVEVNKSGYLLVEFNQGYPEDPEDGQEYTGFATLTWYDANSDFTESVTVPATYNDRNGLLGTEIGSYADDLEIDLTALTAFDEGTLDIGGEEFDRIEAGDKVLYSVSDRNTVDDDAGPEEFTVKLQSISNPDVTTDIQFNQLSGTNQTFQQVEMDENGNVWTYKYNVQFAGLEDDDYNISFNVEQNQQKEIVDYNTQLGELAQFISSDGSEAFATSKDLTIYGGNGESATIHLSGSNTVKELEDKLNQALISMGYGSIDPTINERLVTFVTEENQSMFGNNIVQPGSIVIQTPTPGEEGQLYFSGDEELISGLGISNIRESGENVIIADVYDSYTNEHIGSEVIKDNTMKLLPG
ncbi:MAG: hypothetical protein SVN78_07340, partial [Deferribacterota bacterium]|nr:hypothetical protein [Deferribacterota bacterium]